jgi:hypothetical protein
VLLLDESLDLLLAPTLLALGPLAKVARDREHRHDEADSYSSAASGTRRTLVE